MRDGVNGQWDGYGMDEGLRGRAMELEFVSLTGAGGDRGVTARDVIRLRGNGHFEAG